MALSNRDENMHWKEQLRILEKSKKWDEAISFMQKVIQEQPDDMDAAMFMNYLLINLLGEEDYDDSKLDYYLTLSKKYFKESYSKFSHNAEFLYFMGKIAVMGEWFFDLQNSEYERMIKKAHQLEPENLLYKEHYFYELEAKNPWSPELIAYAKMTLSSDSPVKQQLQDKGAMGEYIWELKQGGAEQILWNAAGKDKEGHA